MKTNAVVVLKYDADEGKVFEWKEPRFEIDDEGNEIQQFLKAKTLFLSTNDSIDNYNEVDE